MPYVFDFRGGPADPVHWRHVLKGGRCTHLTAAGVRCKNRVVIGMPLCWQHLLKFEHLRIRESGVHGGGKGVYAEDRSRPAGAVIFPAGSPICDYHGEVISHDELEHRYGDNTAPYAFGLPHGRAEDGAIERGVGTMINHRQHPNCTAHRRQGRVVIRASRNIRNGEELFLHYGSDYWHDDGSHFSTKYVSRA